MRLRIDQLDKHLEGGLAAVYVLGGDEPLQIQEARDAIRAAAGKQGFDERMVLSAETGFDWGTFRAHAASLSLFGDRRIIDLRLVSGKPGDAGARALKDYAADPPEDNLLLVTMDKFDRGSTATQWYKALEKAGVAIRTFPVDRQRLSGWIRRRASARGDAVHEVREHLLGGGPGDVAPGAGLGAERVGMRRGLAQGCGPHV